MEGQTVYDEYSEDAEVILYPGDTAEFLKTIPGSSVKLIITSPPYNIGKEYEKKQDIMKYLGWQKEIIKGLVRILHPMGSVCWQVGNYVDKGEVFPLDIFYYEIFKDMGLKLRNRMIWHFGHGLHARKRFSGRYETIMWFTKTDSYTFNLDSVRVPAKYPNKKHFKGEKRGQLSGNPLGKNPSDLWKAVSDDWKNEIWEIPNVKANHPEKTMHPCQFPVELVERCVLALTNENDTVFDPFSGTGTSLIAGLKNNRKVMGSEKEKKYVELTKQRLSSFFRGELKTRPLGKPIYQPNEKLSRIPTEWENKTLRRYADNQQRDRRACSALS